MNVYVEYTTFTIEVGLCLMGLVHSGGVYGWSVLYWKAEVGEDVMIEDILARQTLKSMKSLGTR